MASESPLSAPGTPRPASSYPFDDDLTGTSPPSLDDAHIISTQADVDGDWESVSGVGATSTTSASPPSNETATKHLKGKEKARKGPLRLLDLPVDILKEIIHQVSAR
jgi:hypothetical protein